MAVLRHVDRCVAAVAGACVAVTAVLICLNVFNRYVLQSGFVWADEIPGYLLVWISFLGAYLAVRDRGHIAFDLFVTKLPPVPRKALMAAVDLLVIAFLAVLLWLSWKMVGVVGQRRIETVDIPRWTFMIVMPVSAGLMILGLLVDLAKKLRD